MTRTQAESDGRTQETVRVGATNVPGATAGASPPQPPLRRLRPQPLRPRRFRRRGTLTTGGCVLLALVVQGHRLIPNTPGCLGSLADTLLPWTALALPALLATALLRRSPVATAACVLPISFWL